MRQRREHDALEDTRVLMGILRGSLAAAARLELRLPLVACPPRRGAGAAGGTPRGGARRVPRPRKAPCPYRNPGRWQPGTPLVQGMKIAVTGATTTPREVLGERATAAGLNVVSSVSRHTSVLVTNDTGSQSTKARRAAAAGVPLLDEAGFLRLLAAGAAPGVRHDETGPDDPAATRSPRPAPPTGGGRPPGPVRPPRAEPSLDEPSLDDAPPPPARTPVPPPPPPTTPATPAAPAAPPAPAPVPAPAAPERPLSGHRVLVLGGTHPEACAARERIVRHGGSAAVNLSGRVTDVVALPGAERDRRMARITALRLPVHEVDWLTDPAPAPVPDTAERAAAPRTVPPGGVVDLPPTSASWTVNAAWGQHTRCEVDVVAFVVDEEEQVSSDDDFVFYGQPETPSGTVRLTADGPCEQAVGVDVTALPTAARKVVVAAAMNGATFGELGPIEITVVPGTNAAPLMQSTLDAATTEQTLLLAELYRRGTGWRLRAMGQGYETDLAGLARGYGVDVEDD